MDTMGDVIAGLALSLDPKAAGDLHAVIQFQATGEEPGSYYLHIAQGRCVAYEDEHPRPTMTVRTPAQAWTAISRGEMNGATALITSKCSGQGDLSLPIGMGPLFPGDQSIESG